MLDAVIRGYGVRDELLIHGIRLVRSGLHGFADIEAHGGFAMPKSINESFEILVDALDASLTNLARNTASD